MGGFLSGVANFGNGMVAGAGQAQQLKQQAIMIQQEQMKLDAAKRALAGRAAAFTGMGDQGGGQQGGGPPGQGGGQPPMPQPMPPAAPPPQQRMMGPDPGGGAMGGGTPMPQPAQPPQPQGPPPPAQSATAQPSGQGFEADSRKTLQAITQDIQRRNPGIEPLVLADAVDSTIAAMKGLEPETRAYLQASVAAERTQMLAQQAVMKAQSAQEVAEIKAQAAREIAEAYASSREKVAQTNRQGGNERATIGAGSRERVAETNRQGGNERATIGAGARRDAASTAAGASEYRTDAQAETSGFTRPGKFRQGGGVSTTPPAGSEGANYPAPPKGKYKSAAEVQKDFKAGKLTHDQAATVLRRDFGYQ